MARTLEIELSTRTSVPWETSENVVRTQASRMLLLARRLLRNEADAEDVVQEAFLSAINSFDTFDGRAQITTWLHRITINVALMKLRARGRRDEQPIEHAVRRHPGMSALHDHAASPDELIARGEAQAFVRRCLERIPEPYRVVLVLRDIEELDTKVVAERLGLTETSVKVRLHRARRALRTLLAGKFPETEALAARLFAAEP